MIIEKIKRKLKLIIFKRLWRQKNKGNFTNAINIFDETKVQVGKMSYGDLDVRMWGNEKERLVIGNYVSIASNVKFLLGGNHNINTFSTYPFKVMFLEEESEAWSKGIIVVEDDVWIGMNVIVLSGVTIGKGAVIAAGSVVTKDVPEYAIIGGNPAKIIKYRFDIELIKLMKEINLSNFDIEVIKANTDLFYKELNIDVIEDIKKLISNTKNVERKIYEK